MREGKKEQKMTLLNGAQKRFIHQTTLAQKFKHIFFDSHQPKNDNIQVLKRKMVVRHSLNTVLLATRK